MWSVGGDGWSNDVRGGWVRSGVCGWLWCRRAIVVVVWRGVYIGGSYGVCVRGGGVSVQKKHGSVFFLHGIRA